MDIHEFAQVQIDAVNYAEWPMGCDPIGSGDIIRDFVQFVINDCYDNIYQNPKESWMRFNEERLKVYFRLDLPARS